MLHAAPVQEDLPFPQRVVALGAAPKNLAAKGVLHANMVSRKLSRLSARIKALQS